MQRVCYLVEVYKELLEPYSVLVHHLLDLQAAAQVTSCAL